MKSPAAVTLIVAITALPVCAQTGMAHGGFAGHGGFVGHGGVSAPSASRFAPPGRPFVFSPPSTFNRPLPVNPASRPTAFNNHYSPHAPHVPVYRRRGVFITPVLLGAYPYYPYSGYPGLFDDGNDSQQYPSNEQAPQPDYEPAPYPDSGSAPPPGNGPGPYPDYGPAPYPYYAPVPPSAQGQNSPLPLPPNTYSVPPGATYYVVQPPAPPTEEIPVTLIFRNGRAPEQIHNYLLTPTTLIILDQPYRQIPLDQIDIAATAEKNREAGIDFRVPGSPR